MIFLLHPRILTRSGRKSRPMASTYSWGHPEKEENMPQSVNEIRHGYLDLFGEPAFRREAANAAMGADMVLLSAHGHEEMPEAARVWLEGWFQRQPDEPPALIAP